MLGVRITLFRVVALGVLAWLVGSLLLGFSTSGVSTGSTYAMDAAGNPDPNQHEPQCVSTHVFDSRGWGSFETIRYDVWVYGCSDAHGKLQLTSPPSCGAKSFLGSGNVNCASSPAGNRVKVTVTLNYPLGLDHLAGFPNPSTFYVDPGGGYSTY